MQYNNLKLKQKPKKKKTGPVWTNVLLVAGLIITAVVLYKYKGVSAMNPISIVTNVSAANVKETDGRTNVLLLGSDRRTVGTVTSELTDTILLASIGKLDKDVVLISVPRDLWVQDSRGYHMKVNEVYTYGGSDEITKVLENVLGLPIHYYALVDFNLFTAAIDILGGIDIDVENAFTDRYYPIEGKENAPEEERYEIVHFDAGKQTMNGEKALKFARSRKGDNDEGTDFARAKRQQKVIMAIKDKALSLDTLINPQKLKDLYDLYSKNVDTNIDLAVIQNFYLLSQQIHFDKVVSIVLDDRSEANEGGLLYSPVDTTLYGGRYVLIPKTGNYAQIHAFVQKYVFGNK